MNRAIQGSTPSGSVFKPITALAAAAVGQLTPDETVDCNGSIRIGRRAYRCSHRHGTTDLRKAIAQSCNVYFWQIGRRIGVAPIVRMAGDLGFGARTGVDLPYERPGRLPHPQSALNLSIGQGRLQVSPIQVAVAMAAIANGGKVLRPTILLKIVPEPAPEDRIDPVERVAREAALPEAALDAVRDGMRSAVVSGTVRRIGRLKELNAAAKTGTAQTSSRAGAPYHAWLAGYAPHDAPRYAFAVVVYNTPGYGADAAGPIAADVLDALLASPGAP